MSSYSPPLTEATRRSLSDRQARTVQGLAEAALTELRATGYEKLTVRSVARRAGVAPATAYTYFASKEHLVTEVFWRQLRGLDQPRVDRRCTPSDRVTAALAAVARLASDEPELFSATTVAMLAADPEVRRLRDLVGRELHDRFVAALGPDADPAVLRALELALAGALMRAGMGHMTYDEIPVCMSEIAALLLDGKR